MKSSCISCTTTLDPRNSTKNSPGLLTTLHCTALCTNLSRAEQSRSLLPAVSRHGHSWHRAPVGPVAIYLLLVWQLRIFFFLWGALSDERTGLTSIYAAGPCHRNLSLVRAPWVSRPYFTVLHLRLPFLSSPTTRRVFLFDSRCWVIRSYNPGRTESKTPFLTFRLLASGSIVSVAVYAFNCCGSVFL
jgi:hypothetical protein